MICYKLNMGYFWKPPSRCKQGDELDTMASGTLSGGKSLWFGFSLISLRSVCHWIPIFETFNIADQRVSVVRSVLATVAWLSEEWCGPLSAPWSVSRFLISSQCYVYI